MVIVDFLNFCRLPLWIHERLIPCLLVQVRPLFRVGKFTCDSRSFWAPVGVIIGIQYTFRVRYKKAIAVLLLGSFSRFFKLCDFITLLVNVMTTFVRGYNFVGC